MAREVVPRPKGFLGVRHVQISLIFVGLMVTFMNRINLSEGIVAMTDEESRVETIFLTIAEKGALSGAFFWGYAITNVPGGMMAAKIGPIKMLALCLILAGCLNCLLPFVALRTGFYGIYICRIMQGLAQGPIYPSVHTHMSKWAIPQERGILFSLTFGGGQLGSVIMMVIGGWLATSEGGWPYIFYVSGISGIAWAVLCLFIGADSPAVHRKISREERHYIEYNFEGSSKESGKMTVPWGSIFRSGPVWGIISVHLGYSWGFWSLITLTPTYLDGVYNFNLAQNGILSALPYVAMFAVTIILSPIADYINKRGVSTSTIRKGMNSIAYFGSGLALLALGFLVETAEASVICLVVASGALGAIYVGFMGNHIDLSPNFCGILMGMTNGLSNIASITGPSAAGLVVQDEGSQAEWQTFFLMSGTILIVTNVIYIILGSGSIQPWNAGKITTPKDRKTVEVIL